MNTSPAYTIKQIGYSSVPYLLCGIGPRLLFFFVSSECLLHLLPNVWLWNCHCMFVKLRFVMVTTLIPISSACGANTLPLNHHRGAVLSHINEIYNTTIMLYISYQIGQCDCVTAISHQRALYATLQSLTRGRST